MPHDFSDGGLLVEPAVKAHAEKTAAKKLSSARMRMIVRQAKVSNPDARFAFFAMLANKLRAMPVWHERVPTAATDGKNLYYNPQWIAELPDEQLLGVICHEVMHCVLGHSTRRGDRDPQKFNIAADLAINGNLKADGFELPPKGCFPGSGAFRDMPPHMSAEWYYARLPNDAGKGESGDPGGCGGVLDTPGDVSPELVEADWKAATVRARDIAKSIGQGRLPAGIQLTVDQALDASVPWRTVLRRLVSVTARNDYSYGMPNRRFFSQKMPNGQRVYLPSLMSEELGHIVVAFDTSGSIGTQTMEQFAAEIADILSAFQCKLTIMFHDVQVAGRQEWSSTDGPLTLEPRGGGGTSHVPLFREIADMESPPKCVICLTDGYTIFPDEPGVDVIWAMTTSVTPPWGETVRVDDI